MPGWNNLDKILQQTLRDQQVRSVAETDVQDKINAGIRNMFEPVFEIVERSRNHLLREATLGTIPWCFPPPASYLRVAVNEMSAPQVLFQLDRNTSICIRVATLPNRSWPEIITTAKWRCVLLANSAEVENQLFDNRDLLAEWIFRQVLCYHNRPWVPLLPDGITPPNITDQDIAAPSAREHRVIMVDDPRQDD